jgi:hypothetical protein
MTVVSGRPGTGFARHPMDGNRVAESSPHDGGLETAAHGPDGP